MPSDPPRRDYCWTLNKKDDQDDDYFVAEVVQSVLRNLQAAVDSGVVRYYVFQLERGDDSALLHLQGYLKGGKAMRRPAVKRILGYDWAYLAPRNGTEEQARVYCTKPETRVDGPWEGGKQVTQGARTDLDEVRVAIQEGASELDLADRFFEPWCRYRSAFERYRQLCVPVRHGPKDVRVYVGPTGVGKSRSAWDEFPELFVVPVPAAGRTAWFDGYIGQRVVLLDDIAGDEYDIGFWLKLLDRYPMQVPVKCSFVRWSPEVIIITSNVPPSAWFTMATPMHKAAVLRRISEVRTFADDGSFVSVFPNVVIEEEEEEK